MNRRQLLLTGLAAGGLCLLGGRIARAAPPDTGLQALEDGSERMANEIVRFLQQENYPLLIAVGDWVGSAHLVASGGKGIVESLAACLKKKNVTIQPDAPLQVLGKFTTSDAKSLDDADHTSVVLRLLGEVQDKNLETLHKFAINVHGNAVLQIVGPTVDLPPNLPDADRQKKIKDAIEHPTDAAGAIVGNEARASSDSPYGVELHVGGGPRRPELEQGRPYVEIRKDENYALRLYNRSPHEAAVTVTIDGLSMFAFSKEGNFGSQVVIPPGKYIDIPGWYLTGEESARFVVTDYPNSAAGQRNVSTGVGTIVCTFSACWANDVEPPADEGASRGVGTGLGEKVEKKYVTIKRTIGRPRCTVAVRYDR